ncbi:probable long-chain-fatty-acid-CoA ligase [Rhynchosporium graminicola]|uniref:Probable long-chain-fatty-acid-CoA ligase n=1 Tax=Rhynchosporium graminicola TaxID=2792576 RepID=A0A1E1LK07_9HELO|nr:probable long-chain-fatty-acid-CoA ligase [Rhynchosporium commune]
MSFHILDLLEDAASRGPERGLYFYKAGSVSPPSFLSYQGLLAKAKSNAAILRRENIAHNGSIVLLHLDSQLEYVEWFWSIVAAGAIPAVSTPLASDLAARERHLLHLEKILDSPNVLTAARIRGELSTVPTLNVTLIDALALADPVEISESAETNGYHGHPDAPAVLMLTSGSTGNAKAVELGHEQILASVKGKSAALGTASQDVFLNWIGFDHVACVTEIHLHALLCGADQIHVPAVEFLRAPSMFFEVIGKHAVSRTFSPNFFIAAVNKAIKSQEPPKRYNLSSLLTVVSGGEANVVSTGLEFTKIIASMGASPQSLQTAFGMTETSAASHYHQVYPVLEQHKHLEFFPVGHTTNAILQRITDDEGNVLPAGQSGNLELSGPAVFKIYRKNPEATAESFSSDGWFKTGDKGYTDESGSLILNGRAKDSIIINGVKYFSHELESALEAAKIPGVTPSYTAAFSTWPKGADSEEVVIIFLLESRVGDDDAALTATIDGISKLATLYCSKTPVDIIPLPLELLPKSALGKLSRPKSKIAYEAGKYDEYRFAARGRVSAYKKSTRIPPTTDIEKALVEVFAAEFGLDKDEVGVEDSLTNMGVDSIQLIRFKALVQNHLKLEKEIPMISLLQNPSIKGLANVLIDMEKGLKPYDPLVQLQDGPSSSPPIFFFHPGLGEILVFLNLSKFFYDRQVYAVRAPGFNPGEEMHKSIDDMTTTYLTAIRKKQQKGPYILIGYSFGAMIAFEIAKKIEASGDTVGFIGTLNLPPHIKFRMIELDWTELLLNLVYLLGFITEDEAHAMSPAMHELPQEEVLSRIMKVAPKDRLAELDLNAAKLQHWAALSSKLQGLAHDYDPSGRVQRMDVFYAVPLIAVGRDKGKWLEDHLLAWNDFVADVEFHDVPVSHYTMMNTENVFELQKSLKAAMTKRGVL